MIGQDVNDWLVVNTMTLKLSTAIQGSIRKWQKILGDRQFENADEICSLCWLVRKPDNPGLLGVLGCWGFCPLFVGETPCYGRGAYQIIVKDLAALRDDASDIPAEMEERIVDYGTKLIEYLQSLLDCAEKAGD